MRRDRVLGYLLAILVLGLPTPTLLAFNAGLDPSLVAWWKLDEGGGTVVNDSSGNGNKGTVSGNPTWVPGKLGGAFSSNASGYVDCGNSPSLNPTDGITICLWIKSPGFGTNAWGAFVSKGDTGGSYRFGRNNTGNSIHMGLVGVTASGNPWFDGIKTVADDQWHHIAATYDGAQMQLWVDDEVDNTFAATGKISASTTRVMIGENADATNRTVVATFDDIRIYNRALKAEELKLVAKGATDSVATDPLPADKATDVVRDVVLSWKPGPLAGTHNVYFGTSFDDVNSVKTSDSPLCVSKGQDANSYDPAGLLDYGVTYYWRIEEVNATDDHTPFMGSVWSFTAEPMGYPIDVNNITATASSTYPGSSVRNTIDKSGLTGDLHGMLSATMWSSEKKPAKPVWLQYDFDKPYKLYQMLVWNYNSENELELNYSLMDVTVEYSSDGTDFVKLDDVVFNQGAASADYLYNTVVDFGGVTAKSVRLVATSNYGGGRYGLSELRFLYIPVWAREPKPDVNSTGVDPRGLNLTWRSGREAVSHNVFIGSDPAALASLGTVTTTTVAAGALDVGTKYYWRVDEVNDAATPKSWTGAIWYFTTPDFLAVDDFEAYNNDEGTAVFNAWTDGYGTGTNGGQIGYDIPGPYMEKTIRHGGAQATPFFYKNGDKAVNYSEATRTFDTAQDWTVAKADTLRIWVRGRTSDVPTGTLPAATTAFDISSAGADVYQGSDGLRFVYRQLTGDGSITAKVESQTPTNQYAKAGVMIRVGLESGAMQAYMATLPGASNTTTTPKQVEWGFRPTVGDTAARSLSTTPAPMATWLRVTRKGDVFTGEYSVDGVTWSSTGIGTTPQTIAMGSAVSIGLFVCSHVTTTLGEAKFSNVKVTGNVTGDWLKADVGITAQPVGNTADTFYITVEDAAGKAKTVIPALASPACVTAEWQAADVPFSQLTGVNMTKVKKLTFGVGDKTGTSPQHGVGTLYIDDIGVGHATK